jgi:hypothetical protein
MLFRDLLPATAMEAFWHAYGVVRQNAVGIMQRKKMLSAFVDSMIFYVMDN